MNPADLWPEDISRPLLEALVENAPLSGDSEPRLQAAVLEAVTHPGKLARGGLALAATRALRVAEPIGLSLACAVEYFHLASLLLDDLPCMDDALLRRGRLCAHRVHGEATAILAALAFINRAYALIGFALTNQSGLRRLRLQAFLDGSLGVSGLVGGQARDLRFGDGAHTPRAISKIALQKTGTVLSLSLLFPALLVDLPQGERRQLERLCLYWALAYQATDDALDVLSLSVDAGKTTGRDHLLARPNLALALGGARVRRRIGRLLRQAERSLNALVAARADWACLADFHQRLARTAQGVLGQPSAVAA